MKILMALKRAGIVSRKKWKIKNIFKHQSHQPSPAVQSLISAPWASNVQANSLSPNTPVSFNNISHTQQCQNTLSAEQKLHDMRISYEWSIEQDAIKIVFLHIPAYCSIELTSEVLYSHSKYAKHLVISWFYLVFLFHNFLSSPYWNFFIFFRLFPSLYFKLQ